MNISTRLFHQNFEIVRADTPELIDAAYRLRYQVYCDEKGYEDGGRYADRCERDEFDHRAVHSLVRHHASGLFIGVVRLVLPQCNGVAAPLPVEQHCQLDLETSHPRLAALPRATIGEISRFSVSKVYRRRVAEQGLIWGVCRDGEPGERVCHPRFDRRHLPLITLGLIAASFRMCEEHGVAHCYAAMEPTLLRLLQGTGIHFQPLGMPVEYRGMRVPAYYPVAELMPRVLRSIPELYGIYMGPDAAGHRLMAV